MEPTVQAAGRLSTLVLLAAVTAPHIGYARSATAPPSLPAPTGAVVRVTSEPQLQAAVHDLQSHTTILIAPGTYRLTSTLWITGSLTEVSLRGETGHRDDVVLVGGGLTHASAGLVPYAVATAGTVQGIEIADLTIADVYERAILFGRGTARPHVYDVHVVDAGAPFVESQPGVDDGVVEYSVFEYTTTAREAGTAGLSIDGGASWIVRHNLLRNIVGPSWQLAGPAILAHAGAQDTLVEGNTIVNCSVGVALGLANLGGTDHRGGLVRNNMIARASGVSGGPGILVADSAQTQVLNNTVLLAGTYGTPIEYQFAGAQGVVVVNNLLDGAVWARDGATGVESHNVTDASPELFVDAASGDLHLTARAVTAIDRGITVPDVTDDWDGDPRPRGRAYDIGADELGTLVAQAKASDKVLTLTGKVTTTAGAAMPNVSVSLAGGAVSQSVLTDTAGVYTLTNVPSGSNYTVTAWFGGYTFSPARFWFNNLDASQTTDNFVGAATSSAATSGGNGSTPVTLNVMATFTAPATITFNATVSDPRTVTQVTFNANSSAVWTTLTNPYTYTWTNVPAGKYSVTATAQFSQGSPATSLPISFTVNPATSNSQMAPPVVAVNLPSNGSTFAAPANVAVQASGSAAAGLARIDIYAGSTLIGSGGASGTLSTAWTNVQAGSYALTAVATDMNGAISRSAPVSVNVASALGSGAQASAGPVATINLPSSGSTFAAPANIAVLATGSAAAGVARIDIYAGTALIGTGNASTVTAAFTNVPVGTYVLTAVVTDTTGATSQSAPVSVSVANASSTTTTQTPGGPVAAINSPFSGSTFTAPANVTVQASGAAAAGLARIDVYASGTLVGSGASNTVSVPWNNVAAGTYSLTAIATDITGATGQSTPVVVTVTSATQAPGPPIATLTWPTNGSSFTAPASITVQAAASAAAGLARIDVYSGATLLGSGTTSPISVPWNNVPVGTYSLTAVATDVKGATGRSGSVSVTVSNSTVAPAPPVAAVTWPTSNNSFTAPASLTVQASGYSAAGLRSLAVYAGTTLLGSGTSSPIAVPWNNVAAGSYSLTAVATDTTGATGQSAAVTVTVAAPIVSSGVDPTTWPLVQHGNLNYVGAFRLPSSSNNGAFDFGGYPMTYNPANNSLFVGNRSSQVAEVNIPTPVNSPVVSNLPFAGYVQGFSDPVEGHLADIATPAIAATSGVAINGLLVSGGNLYGTAVIYYDANGVQTVSHYRHSLNLAAPSFSGFSAVWQPTGADLANGVSYSGTGYASGYLATVPSAWQPLLGGPAISGQWGLPIITRESFGPDAVVWDPAQLGAVNGKALLYYTNTHTTLGPWAGAGPMWGGVATSGGTALIDGTRTALFFGKNGLGTFCYGDGTANPSLAGTINPSDGEGYCFDPANANKAQHAYPYIYQVWAYDLNDLAAVKAGTKQPWQVVPYATWTLDLPTPEASWYGIGGIGYDSAHQLLYVSQMLADQDSYAYRAVIHVFKIQ